MNTTPGIEFWFDFASTYSYLSVMRIEEAAASHGLTVAWRPFLLGPVFRRQGLETSPFLVQLARGAYMWQDLERQCAKYGLPWKKPTAFPRSSLLPLRIALLGVEAPWIGDFCRQVMQMNFVADRDIDEPAAMAEVLEGLGLPADAILAAAQEDTNKQRLREQTEAAMAKGIFGAPTFFVGEAMFWGNDRLDDALEAASSG